MESSQTGSNVDEETSTDVMCMDPSICSQLESVSLKEAPEYDLRGFTCPAKICKVYDGDTCTAAFYKEGKLWQQKIRILGINTPEIRISKKDPDRAAKKKKGIEARDALRGLILDKVVEVRFSENDNFGRSLAHIFLHGEEVIDISKWMLETGHAVPFKK